LGSPTRPALTKALQGITSFDGGGIAAPSNPAAKKPPSCYLLIDVKAGKFVRDPADPPSGYICSPSGYYYAK
jgi:hypothetical protein